MNNFFGITIADGRYVINILGIKMRIKIPFMNRLGTHCCISELSYFKSQKTIFPHPIGITIAKGTKIGKICTIFQNVTIGCWNSKTPTIGNNVIIYPNSIIIGDVKIGDNAVIGAGSVVTKDVEANSVVAGNPAKIIRVMSGDDKCY